MSREPSEPPGSPVAGSSGDGANGLDAAGGKGAQGQAGPLAPTDSCAACAKPLRVGARFCASCGQAVGEAPVLRPGGPVVAQVRKRIRESWREIRFAFLVYALLLGAQITGALLGHAGRPFEGLLLGETLLVVVAVGSAMMSRDAVLPALRHLGFGAAGYARIAGAALLLAVAVSLFVYAMTVIFAAPVEGVILPGGWAWTIVLVCVLAPVFEELVFRGVLYGTLRPHLSRQEVYWITSVAFAILHLSVLSLPTHVLMGLFFCWLRERSGSLYPAIFAHALHNALALVIESSGILPALTPR